MIIHSLKHYLPPLFPFFIAFALGIHGSTQNFSFDYLIVASMLIGGLVFLERQHRLRLLALLGLATCAGGSLLYLSEMRLLQKQTSLSNEFHDVIATVESIAPSTHPFYSTCITVTVNKMKSILETDYSSSHIRLYIYVHKKPTITVSDCIELKKVKTKIIVSKDFVRYLAKNNVTSTLFFPELHYTLMSRPHFSLRRWLFLKQSYLVKQIEHKCSKDTFLLFKSIFLGNKIYNHQDKLLLANTFSSWGIIHYLARSGLHLAILSFLIQIPLYLFPLPFGLKQGIIFFLITFYYLLSWPSLSFNRSYLLIVLYLIYKTLRIRLHTLHTIVLLCLAMMIYNPFLLFFLDFQLSFGLTLALAWFFLSEKRSL